MRERALTDWSAVAIGALISAVISVVSLRYLLVHGDVLTAFRDVTTIPEASLYRQLMWYTWWELGSVQNLQDIARFYIYLPSLVFPAAVTTRVIRGAFYFVLTFVPFVSFYALLRSYLGKSVRESFVTAIVVAFVYSINPYTIQLLSPPHTYAVSIAFLPAFVVAMVYFLEDATPTRGAALVFTVSVIVTAIVRYAIVLLVVTGILFAMGLVVRRYSIRRLLSRSVSGIVVGCVTVLVNAYWLVPTVRTMGSTSLTPSYALNFETTASFSQSTDYLDIFTMTASSWPTLPVRSPAVEPMWELALLVVPLMSVAALLSWSAYKPEEQYLVLSGALLFLLGFQMWFGTASLFPKAYKWLLFSTPSSLGWMFRVPDYFGVLVLLGLTLSLTGLLSRVARLPRWNLTGRRVPVRNVLLILLILSTGFVGWQRFSGDLDGVLDEGYDRDLPTQYEELDYQRAMVVGWTEGFKPTYTGEPYLTLRGDIDAYLQNLLERNSPGVCQYANSVGADALITGIETSIPCLRLVKTHDGVHTYAVNGTAETFSTFDGGVYTASPVRYISSIGGKTASAPLVESESRARTLVNPDPNVVFEEDAMHPYGWTVRRDLFGRWSRAYTSDPLHGEWHPILRQRNIENWQTDGGDGLVFTASSSRLSGTANATDDDLLASFSDGQSFRTWNGTRGDPNVTYTNDSLRVRVERSSYGWRVVESPPIEINHTSPIEFRLSLRGEDAHDVHLKVAEYDASGTRLSTERISGGGDGTFSERVRTSYVPRHDNVSFVRLEVWQGHETPKPLPNRLWLDDVQVYDLSRFTEPVSVNTTFEVDREGDYKLLARYFKNERGGSIRARIDGTAMSVPTESQVNEFVWNDLGTVHLEAGTHELTLVNVDGFNAVTKLNVVEAEEYQERRQEWRRAVANKTLVHHFEAETDFFRTGTTVTNASNSTIQTSQPKVVNRWTFDANGDVAAWRSSTSTSEAFRITAADGGLNATVRNSTWGWKVLKSPSVGVDSEERYRVRLRVEAERAHAAHLKVSEFDADGNRINTKRLADIGDGTFDTTVRADYQPTNASVERAQFELWQGHETPKPVPNVVTLSDATVTRLPADTISNFNASNGKLVEIRAGDEVHDTVDIVRNDTYRLDVRGAGNLTIEVGNRTYLVRNEGLELTHTGPVRLEAGKHDINVTSPNNASLDEMWLYSSPNETVPEVLSNGGRTANVESVEKITPTKYEVQVNASEPYLLSFAQRYDSLWTATVQTENGVEQYEPERLYGTTNGFWIDETGEHTVTVSYRPQRWLRHGAVISGVTSFLCLGFLVFDWRRRRGSVWAKRIARYVSR